MVTVNQIRLPLNKNKQDAIDRAIRLLRVPSGDIIHAEIAKISVDARNKKPLLVYSVALTLKNESAYQKLSEQNANVKISSKTTFEMHIGTKALKSRPVICGFGPAGMFCALALARAGYKPIVFERGSEMDKRVLAVQNFENSRIIDSSTNIQFGEGGAGTFSDGKLTTRINSPYCSYVTDVLIKHGAPKKIAYMQKPHVGTDILRNVIVSLRNEIISLGGTVYFNSEITGIKTQNNRIKSVITNNAEINCDVLVIASGHSARDTFFMLMNSGFSAIPKTFSVGFRAEHLQSDIDKALYHDAQGHSALPCGEYALSHHVKGRGVYTFCMCPGGSVVAAASGKNEVVTNGMSMHSRSGINANAAVVCNVLPSDFDNNAVKAIQFQQQLEASAFNAGGKNYNAPAQNVQSFLNDTSALNITSVAPTYPIGVTAYNLGTLFPSEITSSLKTGLMAFNRKIKGYTAENVILTGVETRTSCPIRFTRQQNCESVDVLGVYPCGEGAGYAGGIMSAATDGLKVASNIALIYKPF